MTNTKRFMGKTDVEFSTDKALTFVETSLCSSALREFGIERMMRAVHRGRGNGKENKPYGYPP